MGVEGAAYPEQSQATTALVLGILGIACCGPLAIVAWVLANGELEGMATGRRSPGNESTAKAARVLGIVGTVLFGVGIAWFLLALSGLLIFPFL